MKQRIASVGADSPIARLLVSGGLSIAVAALLVVQTSAGQAPPQTGANVNMAAGTELPNGDPFLQRQNEPSIAVSTRNPLHLLATANDYRFVDLPGPNTQLPVNPIVGDAWIGLFTSTNGGSSWNIETLPGFPQDISSAGAASPLRGFEFTADGVVRAGSNGLFYVTGIAANRGDNTPSQIFVARYIDALTQVDPIELSEISIVDWDAGQRFLDKPWIAVGLPTSSRTYSVSDASGRIHDIPCGPVYVGYSVIHGKHTAVERTEIWLATSTDCDSTWTRRRIDDGTVVDDGGDRGSRESDKSDKSRKSGKRGGTDARRLNQGAVITVDHATGDAYVAWRRFKTAGVPDAILFVRCREGRFTCDQITRVGGGIVPFDQGSTAITMRTSAYPTMAVDGGGRVYLAWADRVGPEGDARIVMSTATPRGFGRLRWSAPVQVDPQADPLGRGHQLMPALAYANGQLALTYYSLQEDHLEAQLVCGGNDCSDALDLQEQLVARGDLAAGRDDKVFTQFLAETGPGPDGTFLTADDEPLLRRHTMDVRAVMFPAGALPAAFPAPVNVSRYTFGTTPYDDTIRQLQFNTPLIQLFANGTTPWMGDYQDVSALVAVPDSPPNTGGAVAGGRESRRARRRREGHCDEAAVGSRALAAGSPTRIRPSRRSSTPCGPTTATSCPPPGTPRPSRCTRRWAARRRTRAHAIRIRISRGSMAG